MTESIWLWVGFNVFVLAMLALELGLFHCQTPARGALYLASHPQQHR